jgi:hypothetical protein
VRNGPEDGRSSRLRGSGKGYEATSEAIDKRKPDMSQTHAALNAYSVCKF